MDIPAGTGRSTTAGATWIFRRGRVAAPPRVPWGYSAETGRRGATAGAKRRGAPTRRRGDRRESSETETTARDDPRGPADEVIDNHDVFLARVAVLDRDDARVAVAELAADDDLVLRRVEHVLEALRGAVVRERDRVDARGLEVRNERRHRRVERRDGVAVEVEAVLQRVEVVDDQPRRPAARRQAREELRVPAARRVATGRGDGSRRRRGY